jgi:adenylate kinase family enzyme
MIERIAVIGISASGKSTFARALGAKLGLPVRHGDELDWLPNWGVRPADDLKTMHARWLAEPRWIIEGWIDEDRAGRLDAADLVVDLDFSRWTCTWRIAQRQWASVRRAEMPEGCIDRFEPKVFFWVFGKKERPSIDAALKVAKIKNYVRLTSPRAAARWLAALSS